VRKYEEAGTFLLKNKSKNSKKETEKQKSQRNDDVFEKRERPSSNETAQRPPI